MWDIPNNNLLNECLNGWPDGTVGHHNETELIKQLNDLCQKHGYGRISQLADEIEDIWRDSSKKDIYIKQRAARMKLISRDNK